MGRWRTRGSFECGIVDIGPRKDPNRPAGLVLYLRVWVFRPSGGNSSLCLEVSLDCLNSWLFMSRLNKAGRGFHGDKRSEDDSGQSLPLALTEVGMLMVVFHGLSCLWHHKARRAGFLTAAPLLFQAR